MSRHLEMANGIKQDLSSNISAPTSFTILTTAVVNKSSELTDDDKTFLYAWCSSIILIGFVTNGFVLTMFALKRKLRSVTNYFVVNLAASDYFLTLELIIYLLFIRYKDQVEMRHSIYMSIVKSLLVLGMSASAASLMVVSFDRYCAISRPLRYNTFFTHRTAVLIITGIWSYGTIMFLLTWAQLFRNPMYNKLFIAILAFGNFLVPLCVVSCLYFCIFKIALSHLRMSSNNQDPNSEYSILKKQFRIALSIFVLVFPLIAIWSTFYIVAILRVTCKQCFVQFGYKTFVVLGNLPHLVAAINPITYILLTKDFRSIIALKINKCTKISRQAHADVGLHTDNFQLSTIGSNSQFNNTYKVSSI